MAVLAIDLTWPEPRAQESRPYEPWTVVARWEQAILEKVQGFGGVVLQRTPSLLLVAFGIPRTLEQMPQRAVHAALALRQFVVDDHSLAGEGPPPVLRLGLHWGPLLVAAPADHGTPPIRAVGETLAVPVRLLGQAPPGQVLASGAMARLVDDWCALEPRAARHDSGLAAGDGAYAIVSARAGGTRLAAPAPRGRRPFVGRAREMAILTECWAHAHAGRGQTVGLAGEPGIGKSRLLAEFIRTGQPAGARLLEIRTAAYTQMMPYQPIIDFLRSYCRIEDRDDGALIQDKVIRQLARLELPQKPLLSPFLALLEGPLDDPTWRAMDPALRREHTREAILQVLLRESQVQPLLLVVEDLHWGDAETQAVVDRLVDSITGAPLFLLVTYRPEYSPAWGGRISSTSLRLDPLAPADAEALLEEWLGADAALTPFQRRLVERTQGNPFFLEESVQTLIEAGVLVGGPGAYRLAQALTSLQVPATVQAVLAARIDRLPPEATRLLQTAAVMGQEVPIPLLHTLAERSEDALSRGLAQLQAAEFLYETRLVPDRVYTFRPALTQQVAYETLPQERRRALHARLVEALEALAGDRRAEQVERLAHHALQGAVWEKAVSYCQQAGEKARNRGAAHEAVAHFEQALDALGHLPEPPDTGVLAIELRRSLGNMLGTAGEPVRSLALLGEAEARARQLDDRARLEGVLSRMVTVRWIVGEFEGALAAGREALALSTRLGDPTLHVHAAYHLGQLYTLIGHHSRAAELLRGNVEALTRSTPGDMRWWCIKSQAWLADLLGLLGAFAEGRRHGEEALRLSMEDGPWHADVPIVVRARLGCLSLAQGNMDAAIRLFEEGLALSRTSGYRFPFGAIRG
ncbi:MAG TPA: AAA family ATPase, partial [Vicinamibacteria bacterium]